MSDLILLGGFLGSGKTSLMLKLAEKLEGLGKRVSLITNDQGEGLVDTKIALASGFTAQEITGGCFCCSFSSLLGTLVTITEDQSPDYIIAEAVGSCTDLFSTVIRPLQQFHSEVVTVKRFWVLADGLRYADEFSQLDLEDPILPLEVLASHQLKETAEILISKTDLIGREQLVGVIDRLRGINPKALIHHYSIHDDIAPVLGELLSEEIVLPGHHEELDYDLYAEAEAAYGWYNGSWEMRIGEDLLPADPAAVAAYLLQGLDGELNQRDGNGVSSIAHAKVQVTTPSGYFKAGISGRQLQAPTKGEFKPERSFHVVLNIRAAAPPERLSATVATLLDGLQHHFTGLGVTGYKEQTLIPSRPNPEYHL